MTLSNKRKEIVKRFNKQWESGRWFAIGNVNTDISPFIDDQRKWLTKALSDYTNDIIEMVEGKKYVGDISKFKHIKTISDCKTDEEYVWFIRSQMKLQLLEELQK